MLRGQRGDGMPDLILTDLLMPEVRLHGWRLGTAGWWLVLVSGTCVAQCEHPAG